MERGTADHRRSAVQLVSLWPFRHSVCLRLGYVLCPAVAGSRRDYPCLSDRVVKHHGGSTPPFRRHRLSVPRIHRGLVDIELDAKKWRCVCSQGVDEA
jgi:hypothetical protein